MRSRVLVVLGALTLSMLLPGTVGARNGAPDAAKADQQRIIAYWTPARIASAQPRDYVRNDAGKLVPYARPGGGGGTGAVTGASWPGLGEDPVERRVGRILFSSGGSNWICSGTVASDNDANYSLILTAGHCVFDGNDGWSYNFLFMPDFDDNPDYNCATRVMGCWTANRLSAHSTFVPEGFGSEASVAVDYGFARVGAGNKLGQLDAAVGAYDLKTSGNTVGQTVWAFGYPAEGKYKGLDLIYCTGSTIADPYGADTWGVGCRMNGGSSGGGWLVDTTGPANGSGRLGGVNSYGYSGLAYMFGPILDTETLNVKAAALNGSAANSEVCNVGTSAPVGCPD